MGTASQKFGGKKLNFQAFTASGNWTRPAGVDSVELFMIGGGGGGGGTYNTNTANPGLYTVMSSGGGAGGNIFNGVVNITGTAVGAAIAVTIGAAGAAGPASATPNGGNGGTTSFATLATAIGGSFGAGATDLASAVGGTGGWGAGGGSCFLYPTLAIYYASGGCGSGSLTSATQSGPITTTNTYVPPGISASGASIYGGGGGLFGALAVVAQSASALYPSRNYSFGPGIGQIFRGVGFGGGGYAGMVAGPYPYNAALYGAGITYTAAAIANSGAGGSGSVTGGVIVGGSPGLSGATGYCFVTWWE